MTEIVDTKLKKIWSDFTVKDTDSYSTVLDTASVNASDKAKTIALGFFGVYSGWNGKAYGEGSYTKGLTEQQAHDLWEIQFNKQQQLAKKQLIANGVSQITQSVYDGLILLHWATGKVLLVTNRAIEYRLVNPLIQRDYDTVADMIINSSKNNVLCVKCATVLRLADYGKLKTRKQHRAQGVFSMRDRNELGILTVEEIRRARYAYYAETLNFLPNTPEGAKRQLVKEYESTLIKQSFTYDGVNTVFTLEKSPSMEPQEKLEVLINGKIQQHFYDFTVSGDQLTILFPMTVGDIIATTIRI